MLIICALGIILSIAAPVAAAFPTRRMKSNKSQEAQSCQSTEVWLERFLNLERPDIDCIDSRWGGNGRSHINRIGRQRIHNLMRLFVDVGVDSQSIKKVRTLLGRELLTLGHSPSSFFSAEDCCFEAADLIIQRIKPQRDSCVFS